MRNHYIFILKELDKIIQSAYPTAGRNGMSVFTHSQGRMRLSFVFDSTLTCRSKIIRPGMGYLECFIHEVNVCTD